MKCSQALKSLVLRSITIVVLGAISVSFADAQAYVFGRTNLIVGPGPVAVATGDFNGDGIPDVVSVNDGNNSVSIVLGNVDGGFGTETSYPTGPVPTAVATGDFNGDGNLDLVVTNGNCVTPTGGLLSCGPGTMSILLGNGDGSFQPHFDYSTGTGPSSAATGDFNGDGKLDLAIANGQDGTASVFLGNGDGTFQQQVVYSGPVEPQTVIVNDFNGDQKLDLAVGGSGVWVLLGNGDGTFQPALKSPGGGPMAAADFNHDGKLDLFAAGSVLLGSGDGTFTLFATYPSGFPAAADLNGDGNPDLVISQGGGNGLSPYSVSVLLGNGDGTFQAAVQYGTAPSPTDLVIADLNADGKFDVVVAEPGCALYACTAGSDVVSVLLGFGDGTFVGGQDYSLQANSPVETISADFNGDGNPDLAAETSFASGTGLGVYLGNGDGTFQPETFTSLTQSSGGIAAGDFNGDGKADLATVVFAVCTTTCLPGDVSVLIGNGDGTFQTPVDYTVGLQPEYVAAGDFNGDGKPDLAVSNLKSNTVSVLINNGDGTFQSHVDYSTLAAPGPIITGDFNGDGKLDLVVISNGGSTGSLLLGNGDGTFQSQLTISMTSGTYALVSGDFNGDGKLDLAVTTQTGPGLVLLGNGDGTFQAPMDFADGLDFGLPSAGDFNGDGKLDLAVGGADGFVASILLGNGDGTFEQPIFTLLSAGLLAAADFNQDGSPDIAGGTGYGLPSFTLSVMLNASFKAVSPASLNFGSQGVATTSAAQTITLSNLSSVSLNITSIAASGNFSQTNNCGASLAIGATCAVTVRFTPTATGLESGAITVTDNTRISPLAIPLSGAGVSGPFLTPFPSRVNFSPQNLGTSSNPVAVTLVNTGNAALTISTVSITGANASDFSPNNACGSSLAAGASCTVNVTFTPAAGGSRTASLTITDSAPGSPQSVSLSGTGLGPVANLSLYALTFGSLAVGATSPAQTVTLMNTGSSPLNIMGIVASGDFGETNTCNMSLAAGGNCQISVTFSPTATGSLSGAVTVTYNGSGSPQTITLSGSGVIGIPTTVVLTASPIQAAAGQYVTFNVSVLAQSNLEISGSVTFFDGTTSLGTATLVQDFYGGNVTGLTTSTLGVGTHSITATFDGNATFAASTSAPLQEQILADTLNLGVAYGTKRSVTVSSGNTAKWTLTIGGGGFSGQTTLACSGAPTAANCTVTPSSLKVSSTYRSTLDVSVTTNGTLARSVPPATHSPWLWAVALFGCAVLPIGGRAWKPRSRFRRILPFFLLLLICACGGGGGESSSTSTPAGAYTINVTATSGSTTETVPLTLIVQ
jgi:hypothetical protein